MCADRDVRGSGNQRCVRLGVCGVQRITESGVCVIMDV